MKLVFCQNIFVGVVVFVRGSGTPETVPLSILIGSKVMINTQEVISERWGLVNGNFKVGAKLKVGWA